MNTQKSVGIRSRSKFATLFFAVGCALFFAVACQKPLHDDQLKYIGSWGSDKFSLEIWKDGRGVYEKKNYSPYECRVEITGNQLKFKGSMHKPFTITQDPYVDSDGFTVMILDGETFYKH